MSDPYEGLTREELLPILEQYHGCREKIPDGNAFNKAWAANFDKPKPERWKHPEYPDARIAAMSFSEVIEALEKTGGKVPRGFDLMPESDLKAILSVHIASEVAQRSYYNEQEQKAKIAKKNALIEKALPTTNSKGDKATPEYLYQERGWFERDGGLFLSVIDPSDEIPAYEYARLENGEIVFVDDLIAKEPLTSGGKVVIPGVKYIPRKLPLNKDGQLIPLVGIPKKQEISRIKNCNVTEIKDLIYRHINTYCDLSHNDVDLCVYYIFMTWFYPKLTTLPYIRFRADTGKGKSRILRVISDLSFMPVRAGGASTAAGTIRIQEAWHGTLVIDEADIKGGGDDSDGYQNDMIKFLNLGFEKGQYFVKSDKVDPKRQEIFDPFSPKIIAMRGIFQDPATEGRCLSITPSETERTDIPAILPDVYYTEVDRLRAQLAYYTITNWDCITDKDPYPSFNDVECEPRLKQLGSPVARVISKIFPDGLSEFKHYIERRQMEVKIDRAGTFIGCIVNAAYDRAIDPENNAGVVSVHEIAEAVGSTSQKASRVLKDAGMDVEPRKVRMTISMPNQPQYIKTKTQKIAVVKSARVWREICRRYITARSEQNQFGNAHDMVDCPQALKGHEYVAN